LGLRLAAEGHGVWGLRRSADRLPAPIRPLSADLLGPGLGKILPDADAVVYAVSADGGTPEAYRAAYVDGLGNLLEALRARGSPPARILFTSSTAVWGDRAGEWVDETTPPDPDNFRGAIVLEGESALGAASDSTTTLRLGGIYGPGRTRLLERVQAGEARCPEAGSPADATWSNRIHRDDAARALAHLLTLDDPDPVYVGVDDAPARLCDVYTHLAGLLGVPPPERGGGDERSRSNKRCSNARLRATGFEFLYPTFREGYRAMIEAGA
jgi:nucleoside-diphosphate-sugar epimerase